VSTRVRSPLDVTIEPTPTTCPAPRRLDALPSEVARWRRETLASLGIDADRSVVATGHQAAIWHPGILAKDLAVRAIHEQWTSRNGGATPLHFIADHDANDGGLIRLPAWSETGDQLHAIGWRLRPAGAGRSTRDLPAGPVAPPPPHRSPIPDLAERIDAIRAAADRHADASSLAMQLGGAAADLADPFTGVLARRSMSSLLQAPIGVALLERMRSDPDACIDAHDAAIAADQDARSTGRRRPRGVASLLRRSASAEWPFWRATPDGRRPVVVGEPLEIAALRPRALLATALARLGGCDLFVHGLGGGVYDRVMEDWLTRWLGPDVGASLAPAIVTTATLRLPLPVAAIDAPMTPEALHRLRNDPDLASDEPPTLTSHLTAIDAAPRRSPQRRAAYLALRAAVAEARLRGESRLADAERRMSEQRRIARSNAIAVDRTWAFPLHDDATLQELRERITHAFEGS
jgi:hypothetical protein